MIALENLREKFEEKDLPLSYKQQKSIVRTVGFFFKKKMPLNKKYLFYLLF